MRLLTTLACCLATPVAAEDLRPAPEYFVTAAMETSTAQILAVNCSTLSVDLGAMARRSEATLVRLTEDGFTPQALAEGMEDPSDAIAVLQQAFLSKHGLSDGAAESVVCDAGLAEIAEETGIGALLLEVEGG
ncbi:hypothetical protein JANAI62_33740 [Jannaschia pagri]|uniref:Uncharacterized protein n=1 Tax=Jannaschia pagri TaxID=2829797 RepID=A0ABQ4NQY2_9RHOB|nr:MULTISPECIES: DUF5333 family protein [unclassified Jannaschia]GIT92916.1 hypothetical protein JANAI61_33740 [Jannaschia sp. AI_61]GIT96751.1 hypothetical protein JANAI62_33740 [Jannaschia sp. AI_62]